MTHTPLCRSDNYVYEGEKQIADCDSAERATLIVRCVNNHDGLVAVCAAVVKWADDVPSPYREWGFVKAARAALADAEKPT